MNNYDLHDLPNRILAVTKKLEQQIESALSLYAQRKRARNKPVIAVSGHSRCGKDEVAKILSATAGFCYSKSQSQILLPFLAETVGLPVELVWETRHQHSLFWKAWANTFRSFDQTLPVRMSLGFNDLLIGIRSKVELDCVKAEKLADVYLWVDRPGIAEDPTQEYGKEDCDLVLVNDSDLVELEKKVSGFVLGLN